MTMRICSTTRPYEDISFGEACVHIANAGYDEIAVYGHFRKFAVNADSTPSEIEEVKEAAKEAGLAISTLHGSHKLRDLELEPAIANYKTLIDNAACLGVKWLLDIGIGQEEKYGPYYEMISEVAPYAHEKGVVILLKPHGGIALTASDAIAVCEKIDHPAYRICYDPGNLIFYTKGKADLFEDLERIVPLSQVVIIKDCVVRDGVPDVKITPGEGLVDFERVLGCFAKNGFQGPLYVECVGGEDHDEIERNLRTARKYIKGILAGQD